MVVEDEPLENYRVAAAETEVVGTVAAEGGFVVPRTVEGADREEEGHLAAVAMAAAEVPQGGKDYGLRGKISIRVFIK